MNYRRIFVSIVLSALLLVSLVTVTPSTSAREVVHTETTTGNQGTEFEAIFYSDMTVEVIVTNASNRKFDASFVVAISNTRIARQEFDTKITGPQTWTFDLKEHQDPRKEQQKVEIGIYGDNIFYTYNRTPTAEDSNEVEMAHIADIELEPRNSEEDPGVDLLVTVEDPSVQSYRMNLLVHTEGTNGAIGLRESRENGTHTYRVELYDDPDEVVRGEIRLFNDEVDDMNDSLDMVEFEARVDGETDVENVSYDPIDEPGYYRYGEPAKTTGNDDAVEYDPSSTVPIEINPGALHLLGEDGTPTATAVSLGILGGGLVLTGGLFVVGLFRRL